MSLKESALEGYIVVGSDMNEFNSDFLLPRKIASFIRRWKQGKVVNLRLLINMGVTYFNCFERKVAVRNMYDLNSNDVESELKSLLLVLNKTRRTDYRDVTPNDQLLKELLDELR